MENFLNCLTFFWFHGFDFLGQEDFISPIFSMCHYLSYIFFLKIYFEGVTNVHAVVGNSIQGFYLSPTSYNSGALDNSQLLKPED